MAKFKLDEVSPASKIKMLKYLKLLVKDLRTLGILRKSRVEMIRTTHRYHVGNKKHKTRTYKPESYVVEIYTKRTRYTFFPSTYRKPKLCLIEKFYRNCWGKNAKEVNLQSLSNNIKKTKNIKLNVL